MDSLSDPDMWAIWKARDLHCKYGRLLKQSPGARRLAFAGLGGEYMLQFWEPAPRDIDQRVGAAYRALCNGEN